jgi:hypothetical protein
MGLGFGAVCHFEGTSHPMSEIVAAFVAGGGADGNAMCGLGAALGVEGGVAELPVVAVVVGSGGSMCSAGFEHPAVRGKTSKTRVVPNVFMTTTR